MTDFAARRDAVRGRLEEGIETLLVTSPDNVRYLTGFTGSNGQLLLADDPLFLTDGRYTEQSAAEVRDVERRIYAQGEKLSDAVGEVLGGRGIRRLAFEAAHVSVDTHERLADRLDTVELVPMGDAVEAVRACKGADEVETLRRAQRVAETALGDVLAKWSGGTELELALELEWAMRTGGAEDVSFDTIVASGAHAALPHAQPRDAEIPADAVLLIDMGARVEGYCSDMTRTFLRGAPDPLPRAHEAVLRALEAGVAAARPGTACAEVDAAARRVLEEAGFGEAFVHSTGHGVGLDVHEGPRLAGTSEETLEPGMAITVEPGVYLPGVGGIRVEDLVVVGDGEPENLTAFPRGPEWPS